MADGLQEKVQELRKFSVTYDRSEMGRRKLRRRGAPCCQTTQRQTGRHTYTRCVSHRRLARALVQNHKKKTCTEQFLDRPCEAIGA